MVGKSEINEFTSPPRISTKVGAVVGTLVGASDSAVFRGAAIGAAVGIFVPPLVDPITAPYPEYASRSSAPVLGMTGTAATPSAVVVMVVSNPEDGSMKVGEVDG